MAQGLQVWDASGAIVLDVAERLTRFITSGSYQAPAGSSSFPTVLVSVPGMSNDGTWIAVATAGPGAGNPVSIVNGGFNVVCNDTTGGLRPVNYFSVYRV